MTKEGGGGLRGFFKRVALGGIRLGQESGQGLDERAACRGRSSFCEGLRTSLKEHHPLTQVGGDRVAKKRKVIGIGSITAPSQKEDAIEEPCLKKKKTPIISKP